MIRYDCCKINTHGVRIVGYFKEQMTMAYRIVTDTGCDFPQEMYQEKNLVVVPLSVNYKGKEYTEYTESWLQEMYEGLRAGESATTSAVNPEGWSSVVRPILEQGEDALILKKEWEQHD